MPHLSHQPQTESPSDADWVDLLVLKIALASFLLILGVGLLSWLAMLLSR